MSAGVSTVHTSLAALVSPGVQPRHAKLLLVTISQFALHVTSAAIVVPWECRLHDVLDSTC